MYKKLSYTILAATISLSFLPSIHSNHAEAAGSFSDVDSDYWAESEISFLENEGVIDGRESGEFSPEEDVARAQAAKMISNALTSNTNYNPSTTSFSDVDETFWAYEHIERTAELGAFTGKEDGSFNPNGSIQRAQVAAIIGRAFFGEQAEQSEGSTDFNDISSDFWAGGYISTLVDNEIIETSNEFRPNENATRAEVSAYLARAMEEDLDNIENSEQEETIELDDAPSNEDLAKENVVYTGEVNADTPLNVRRGPGMNYDPVTSYNDGTTVDIYGRSEEEWLKIEHEGNWAYVYNSYIEPTDDIDSEQDENTEESDSEQNGNKDEQDSETDSGEENDAGQSKSDSDEEEENEENTPDSPSDTDEDVIAKAKVTVSDFLNVRTEGNAESENTDKLYNGDIVNVIEHDSEDWALISYDNTVGYVHRHYIQEKQPGEDALKDKTIVIDAGHGDHDNGASGNGLIEKDVVLDVALEVEERLEDEDVDVVMTRSDDTFLELGERVNVAEDVDADSFVSIHANAYDASATGAESFYNNDHKAAESQELAESIQDELVSQTGMVHRRVTDAGYVVIENTTMPSSLIELGFVTNKDDSARMKEAGYADDAADAIFDGIDNYYNW
ncbi:hypothetical protein D7Z54_12100 [Salibacterium salarium]|uniref:N-acetylmuramoyl-L-alanine amidase n=1 Tax=Salibacterium salarium TaxID=284579 RepID=A0A428N445_9BACI|nr:N-acetylmuramoyl-L-alanine amidase [Salibacterium salarium]RSL33047.1 hypothetical protein D7Z54_12100 [Salibacterium salarium]